MRETGRRRGCFGFNAFLDISPCEMTCCSPFRRERNTLFEKEEEKRMIVYPPGVMPPPRRRLLLRGTGAAWDPRPCDGTMWIVFVCSLSSFARPARRLPVQSSLQKKQKEGGPGTRSGPLLDCSVNADHAAACLFPFYFLRVCLGSRFFLTALRSKRAALSSVCVSRRNWICPRRGKKIKKKESCRGRRRWRPAACDVTGISSGWTGLHCAVHVTRTDMRC